MAPLSIGLNGIVFWRYSGKNVMKQQQESRDEQQKKTDVTRSERQQTQSTGAGNTSDREQRPEGSRDKGNPSHKHGSHKEGQVPYQSDDPTMEPSGIDE